MHSGPVSRIWKEARRVSVSLTRTFVYWLVQKASSPSKLISFYGESKRICEYAQVCAVLQRGVTFDVFGLLLGHVAQGVEEVGESVLAIATFAHEGEEHMLGLVDVHECAHVFEQL